MKHFVKTATLTALLSFMVAGCRSFDNVPIIEEGVIYFQDKKGLSYFINDIDGDKIFDYVEVKDFSAGRSGNLIKIVYNSESKSKLTSFSNMLEIISIPATPEEFQVYQNINDSLRRFEELSQIRR